MYKVHCDGCNQDVEVALYFSDKCIITHEDVLNNVRYYEAVCIGESICPICGCTITKLFKKTISNKSIVDLAVE